MVLPLVRCFACLPRSLAWLPVIALVLLSGCKLLTRDASADQAARSLFEEVSRHQTEAFTSRLGPALQGPEAQSKMAYIEGLIPVGKPQKRIVVGTDTFMSTNSTTVLATDEYDYADLAALVQTRLFRASDTQAWSVQGFHVQVASFKQLQANDFGLTGKSVAQYAFLVLLVASPLVILAALVKVLRTGGLRRKWLWCAISVFGIGQVQMNWATGVVAFNLLAFDLFGAGGSRASSSFAPWILTAGLPIAAVLILAGIWANPARVRKAVA